MPEKESLVGAVQSVKPSDAKPRRATAQTSFSGKIAGVIADAEIRRAEPAARVPGFAASRPSVPGQSPLLILDGVEITNQMLNNASRPRPSDRSPCRKTTATALYGSRGANGVMIITMTKSGATRRKNDPSNLRAEFGILTTGGRRRHRPMETFNKGPHDPQRTAITARKDYGNQTGPRPYVLPQRRLGTTCCSGRTFSKFQL